MMTEPKDRIFGTPLDKWLEALPLDMSDTPVGLWRLVPRAEDFGFADARRVDFLRRAIRALLDAGGMPVRGAGLPGRWVLQTQYGAAKPAIVAAVVAEWQAQGSPTPEPWTGLAFGLPWSYAKAEK
jgi:hypothetical protein